MEKKNFHLKSLLLLVAMIISTAVQADLRKRMIVSQDYETVQTADWQGDAGASITLATGDAVNGTCVQIEATEGNASVYLPVQLPDEVFYRDQYMSGRGYVVEFDFMIRSGNVADVSESQFFVLTQGTYPYYDGEEIEPDYYWLNEGGQPVNKWSSAISSCLSQPVRTESTYNTTWFMSNNNQGENRVFESDKWYHFSAYPEYVKEGQFPGFWFEYTIREKETGTWIYGGGSGTEGIARLTGFCALVGQGGMLKFDNLQVYDYNNYQQPVFTLVGANGTERTYRVTNPNAEDCTLYYTTQLYDGQPAIGDPAYTRTTNKESGLITISEGTGYLYAYVATDDNDDTPSAVTAQYVDGTVQTLLPPYHQLYNYDAQTGLCEVMLECDQSRLLYTDYPDVTILYSIDGSDYQEYTAGDKGGGILVPTGSELKYYATATGYNDSPVVTVTAGLPLWQLGLNNAWYDSFAWEYPDRSLITLGEEIEDGLYEMRANYSTISEHLLTPNENINGNFMIRKYSPNSGIYDARRHEPTFGKIPAERRTGPAKQVRKVLNVEEMDIRGIYSGDDRTYAITDVKEGGYIELHIQGVENLPVVTPIEGLEIDPWNCQGYGGNGFMKVLKVTTTGTVRFTLNSGTALAYIYYYEPAPPEVPTFYPAGIDGANRTFHIYNNTGGAVLHYTTTLAAEQPALDSDAWSTDENGYAEVTVTGKGYLYAYATNSIGMSEVVSQYVNGVELTMNTPCILNKTYNSNTKLWTVEMYLNPKIEGAYHQGKIWYSIDGGEETQYTEPFTIANGQQLSYCAKAQGYKPSATVTCTAGQSLDYLEQEWYEYYGSGSYWYTQPITLGEAVDVPEGFYKLSGIGNGRLLTLDENIDDQFQLKYYGIYSATPRTYAVAGLEEDQYLYILTNDNSETNAYITPIEGLEYDGWNSSLGEHFYRVTADGAVKFAINGDCYLREIAMRKEPPYGYLTQADANGNILQYYYEDAESDLQFTAVTDYAADEEKAGHIIIADKVTDRKGRERNVTSIKNNAVSNSLMLKSVVFGQNIKTIEDGSSWSGAFYSCSELQSVTLNSNLESLGSYTFQYCYKLNSINLADATKITTIPLYCFQYTGLEEINLPDRITEIGEYAFYGCDSLVTININTANIPVACFSRNSSGTSKLRTINIGADVKAIGNSAFRYQKSVTALNFDPAVSELTIGNYAFENLDSLRTTTLPKGITSLGNSVFSNCDSLRTVVFDEESTLTELPSNTFYYCRNLQNITLPNSVETIGSGVFESCPNLQSVTLPGVKTVGSSAFDDCTSLRELTFGTALEEKGFANSQYLFYNCTKMEKMTIPGTNFPFQQDYSGLPNSMTIFVDPSKVEDYKANSYTKKYHIVPIGATTDFDIATTEGGQLPTLMAGSKATNAITLKISGYINGTDVNHIHQMPYLTDLDLTNAQIVKGGEDVKRWTLSNGVVKQYGSDSYEVKNDSVCDYMFYNMPNLRHVALPEGAKYIGKYAFNSNPKLEQAELPTALLAIDEYAFNSCSKLTKADLPEGLQTIGSAAFGGTSIESVTIPAGVKRVESSVFYNCSKLKTAVLPDGLEYIGSSAFYYCSSLKSVNIPSQVKTIESYAFYDCTYLESPIVIPATCETIGYNAFYSDYSIPSVTFANEQETALKTIGSYAFYNLTKLEQVTLPESLTSLGDGAFQYCTNLKSFVFPSQVKVVPNYVLQYCYDLESVTLAEGTTQIGNQAFSGCSKLATINLDGQPLVRIQDQAFYNTAITSVTLPESVEYMGATVFSNCHELQTANIPSKITSVPNSTFYNCEKLTSVTLHDNITSIGSSAFNGCKLLTGINLPDKVTYISSQAFYNCESLQFEKLPAAIQTIYDNAFYNTKALNIALTIPETVSYLGSNAFKYSGITSLVMTKKPNTFGQEVFGYCEQLSSVTLPATLTELPTYTFQGCAALKSIDLPAGLTSVGYGAFKDCGLESITLPQTLLTIGQEAFYGNQFEEIRVPKKVTSVGNKFAANNKQLKRAYLGRNQSYTNNNDFDYFMGCDNLELLRVYAGTPPKISSSYSGSYYNRVYYTGYRTNCILEVPEGQVDIYKATSVWNQFKEIRAFESDAMLNDADYAVLKDLYNNLGGESWTKPWNLTNQLYSIGKWQGVSAVVDKDDDELFHISAIDLTEQNLAGKLPKSVFALDSLKTLNLSHNTIEALVDTLMDDENPSITVLNMEGNHLKGDLYPLVSNLPNLTELNVSYNWLTNYSQKTSNSKLDNYYMRRGYQFIDWNTKQVVVPEDLEDEVVIDFTPGTPVDIHSNKLQTYRHEYGDFNLSFSNLERLYWSGSSWRLSDWELEKNNGLWDLSKSYLFKAPKGLVAYTHGHPYYSYITYILRIDWEDGDVNGDQTIDVADLQNVIYYALNESKPSSQMYNFTAADANSDGKINVSDIVGNVNYILAYEAPAAPARINNKVMADGRNTLLMNGNQLTLANADEVAALQLTVSGATQAQLQVSQELRNRFSVTMRDVDGGVKIVAYSPAGNTLAPGQCTLLNSLPMGAAITDACLVDSEAQHLSVTLGGETTAIETLDIDGSGIDRIYDLSGRRMGQWHTLPHGVYIIHLNGKQYKVKK